MRVLHVLAVAAALAAGPAMAMDAYTRGTVILQSAPLSGDGPALPPGSLVDMKHCADDWCLVRVDGEEGWIAEKQLALRGPTP